MNTRTLLAFFAAALGAAAALTPVSAQTPAATQTPPPDAAEQQCRWVAPAQAGGPRAPVRAATWTCTPATSRQKACGRYVLEWPHWASQRALPLVRRWVPEAC